MLIYLPSKEVKNKEAASDRRICKGACNPNPFPLRLQAGGETAAVSFSGRIKRNPGYISLPHCLGNPPWLTRITNKDDFDARFF
jgi:hypothetical protein